jgi:hypothetical protein
MEINPANMPPPPRGLEEGQHTPPPRPERPDRPERPPPGDEFAPGRGEGPVRGIAERTRRELNASILSSASEVSLSAGNRPLHLLYSAAIDKLNEVLAPELGEEAIQKAAERPDDFTPEKTAERIVDFATSFYDAFSKQHPELEDPEERLDRFLELVGGGIDKGFGEARSILDGLKVLDGEIADGVDRTYELVQDGLKAFREEMLARSDDQQQQGDNSDEEEMEEEQPGGQPAATSRGSNETEPFVTPASGGVEGYEPLAGE